MSSIAVTPVSARWSSLARARRRRCPPARRCRYAARRGRSPPSGRPRQSAESPFDRRVGSTSRLGPWTSPSCARAAGSGTADAVGEHEGIAVAGRDGVGLELEPAVVRLAHRQRRVRSMRRAADIARCAGAQSRKRAPPSTELRAPGFLGNGKPAPLTSVVPGEEAGATRPSRLTRLRLRHRSRASRRLDRRRVAVSTRDSPTAARSPSSAGSLKGDRLVVGVEQDQQPIAVGVASSRPTTLAFGIGPVAGVHLARRPAETRRRCAVPVVVDRLAVQEACWRAGADSSARSRIRPRTNSMKARSRVVDVLPVEPGDLVVLAIGVVVAVLACGRPRRPSAASACPAKGAASP